MRTIDNSITTLTMAFHPGETLDEKLQEMDMTMEECAKQSGIPECILSAIVRGEASVTADIAVALEDVTQIPAQLWLRKQNRYDEYVLSKRQSKSNYLDSLRQFTRRAAAAML